MSNHLYQNIKKPLKLNYSLIYLDSYNEKKINRINIFKRIK